MNNLNSIVDYLKVFNNINKRPAQEPRTMAQEPRMGLSDGQLVQNTVDGSRPGYNGLGGNIRLSLTGNAYDVAVKRGDEWFRESFHKDDYKNKSEALKAAKKFRDQKKQIPFKTGVQEPKYGPTSDMKKYMEKYREETNELTEKGKLAKNRETKLKNFIGKKKKIKASVLKDFIVDNLGYEKYEASKIKTKFPNLIIERDLGQGDWKPLTNPEKTIIKNNFDLPEGEEDWNFKKHRYGISSDKHSSLWSQIKRRLKGPEKYKIAANFSDPQGWMMSAMNRVYENETTLSEDGTRVSKKGVKRLTYEPKFNKKGTIVGFKDNTVAGDGNTYYGLKKNAKEYGDGTEWRAHGDFSKVDKFLKIANGVKEEPDKLLQKILDDKGISELTKGNRSLTLNDILSHERYYSKLSETSPNALIRRQIVLHHTGGVGDRNLARAAATKDIQLLTDAVNLDVTRLENIVKGTVNNPARKLNANEIVKLKNYGAKIVDFDGKTVGGGYTDPIKQFAAIEKDALKYAKGKDFNVKTVTSYLERLGCGKAAGGRIMFGEGTSCAKKGEKKLNKLLFKGGGTEVERGLVQRIISGGGKFALSMLNPRELIRLSNLVGPAALGIMVGYEAGSITDDVLRLNKPLDEALAGNWLTKSFLPYSEEFAKQKNLLQSGNLTGSQREYALEMMKMEEFMKEGKRIENLEANKLVENTLDDKFEFTSEEDMNKAYQGLFERLSRIKPYAYEEGITGRSLENEAAMNEYQDSRLAKTGEYTSAVSEDKFRLPGQRQIKRDENYEFASSPIFGGPQRLVNKAPRPKNIGRGPMTEKGRMKLDFSIPGYTPYDKVYTPSNDEILNYYKKQGIRHPRFGQLEPGEGTGIRMDLASRDGNRSIYGAGQKMATGGIMNLKKKW